jgi:hypothetical protein
MLFDYAINIGSWYVEHHTIAAATTACSLENCSAQMSYVCCSSIHKRNSAHLQSVSHLMHHCTPAIFERLLQIAEAGARRAYVLHLLPVPPKSQGGIWA